MIVNHFTNLNPAGIRLGDIHSTNWSASKYWERTLLGVDADAKNDQETNQHINSLVNSLLPFIPAQAQQSINDLLRLTLQSMSKPLMYSTTLLKEYIFEEVRINNYPSAPSRRTCLYAFDTTLDPAEYARSMHFDLTQCKLLHLELLEESSHLRVDKSLLDCNVQRHEEIVARAHRYWQGTNTVSLNAEILIQGRVRIINVS